MTDDRIKADVSKAIDGLNGLEKKMAKKIVRQALRKAAKPTLAVAKSTAPERTGLLKQSIKLRSAGVKRGTYKMIVGLGKKWNIGPTFIAGFVAFGHKIGRRELGSERKQVPANEWLDRAYEETAAGSIEIFSDTVAELIEEA